MSNNDIRAAREAANQIVKAARRAAGHEAVRMPIGPAHPSAWLHSAAALRAAAEAAESAAAACGRLAGAKRRAAAVDALRALEAGAPQDAERLLRDGPADASLSDARRAVLDGQHDRGAELLRAVLAP